MLYIILCALQIIIIDDNDGRHNHDNRETKASSGNK